MATDTLKWLLDFKASGLTKIDKDLHRVNQSVNTLDKQIKSLTSSSAREKAIKINTSQVTSAITKTKALNHELAKLHALQSRGHSGVSGLGHFGGVSSFGRGIASRSGGISAGGVSSGLGGAGMMALGGIGLAIGAGYMAVRAFSGFMGEAVDVIKQKENVIRNYTVMLGSSAAAQAEYFKAASFSQKTDLTFEQTTDIQQRLMNAGFRNTKDNKMLDKALFGIADLAALQEPSRREGFVQQFTAALTKTAQRGTFDTRALNSVGLKGVFQADVIDSIRRQMGLDKKADVRKMIGKGQVGANVGISAVEEAILKKTNQKELGAYAVGAAGTMGGLMSNLGELKSNIIRSLNFDEIGGFKKFKEFLKDITDNFNVFEGKGLAFRDFIHDIIGGGFEIFTILGNTVKKFLVTFVGAYQYFMARSGLEDGFLSKKLSEFGDLLGEFASAIGTVAGWAIPWLIKGFGLIVDFSSWSVEKLKDAAWWIGDTYDTIVYDLRFLGLYIKNFWKNIGETVAGVLDGYNDIIHGKFKQGWKKVKEAGGDHDIRQQTKWQLDSAISEEKKKKQAEEIAIQEKEFWNKKSKEARAKEAHIANVLSEKNLIRDQVRAENKKGGGGGHGPKAGLFTPSYDAALGSAHLQRMAPAIAASAKVAMGMATGAMPMGAQVGIMPRSPMQNNVPVTLNFTINGDNKSDEIAQKVEVALTRVFGRLTINPTPAVL